MNIHSFAARASLRPGLSLVELTVVILVVITLLGLLFFGVKAYKAGSDRAACVMNIYMVQNAVRSYSNLNGLSPGQRLRGERELRDELVGPGCFFDAPPACPSGGIYTDLGNRVPSAGEVYLTCSLSARERHRPQRLGSW